MKKVTIKECIGFFEALYPEMRVQTEAKLIDKELCLYYEVKFHIVMEDLLAHCDELEEMGEKEKEKLIDKFIEEEK